VELRDYQQSVFNDSTNAFLNGAKGICCVLPCRSGKSYIMARMIKGAKGNVLVLAHRHTLINQHKELLSSLGVLTDNVRVESVFTEASRLDKHSPSDVDLIIIDEAHLSEANSYRKVCEFYNCRRVYLLQRHRDWMANL
jgi:superfamily II DNA or RNA helicase